jgi:hypothetical protein
MKGKNITKLFEERIKQGVQQPRELDDVAILYGHDQVKLDHLKSRVRLPDIGWIFYDDSNEHIPKKPDWVAYIKINIETHLILGIGNPFDDLNKAILPCQNDTIMAIPY